MFKNYGKPEWFWQTVNLGIYILGFWLFVLPHKDELSRFFGYLAFWLVIAYLLFMTVHGTAGGVSQIHARIPVKPTIAVGLIVATFWGLAVYFDISTT